MSVGSLLKGETNFLLMHGSVCLKDLWWKSKEIISAPNRTFSQGPILFWKGTPQLCLNTNDEIIGVVGGLCAQCQAIHIL